MNLRMQEKIEAREAIDVRRIGTEIEPGVFELMDYIDDVDYCDAEKEKWIWSIGRDAHGRIFASYDFRYYQNPAYTCLWLR